MRDVDLDGYRAFVRTVEAGTITAAAQALGIARPTLSRQLAALEEQLGLALLARTTRSVTPTPAGRRLYAEAAAHVDAIAGIARRLRDERQTVSGRLRVSAPPVLGPAMARLLVELQAEHPALDVELSTDVRHVDLRAEGIDVAVRAGRVGDPELVQRRLGRSRVGAFASPGYLAGAGAPADLDALTEHTLLRGVDRAGRPQAWWPLYDGGRIAVDGRFCSDDQRALLDAALAGGGVALLSAVTADGPTLRGDLVPVLPVILGAPLDLYAVTTRRTLQPARIGAFVEAAVRWAVEFAADGGSRRPADEM